MPTSKAKTVGLISKLCLAVGVKVMLTVNLDISYGLVNGARGAVVEIVRASGIVSVVFVNFSNSRVGATATQRSHYNQRYPYPSADMKQHFVSEGKKHLRYQEHNSHWNNQQYPYPSADMKQHFISEQNI